MSLRSHDKSWLKRKQMHVRWSKTLLNVMDQFFPSILKSLQGITQARAGTTRPNRNKVRVSNLRKYGLNSAVAFLFVTIRNERKWEKFHRHCDCAAVPRAAGVVVWPQTFFNLKKTIYVF